MHDIGFVLLGIPPPFCVVTGPAFIQLQFDLPCLLLISLRGRVRGVAGHLHGNGLQDERQDFALDRASPNPYSPGHYR